MNRTLLFLICLVLLTVVCPAQKPQTFTPKKELLATIGKNFTNADAQYKELIKYRYPEKFPKTYYPATGKYECSNSGWWCSGFYPGTLLYLYEQTKDSA